MYVHMYVAVWAKMCLCSLRNYKYFELLLNIEYKYLKKERRYSIIIPSVSVDQLYKRQLAT